MSQKKVIKVGVDLDGVIAQHSLGGFWVWARRLKEKALKKAALSNYYYPTTSLERLGWRLINWSRLPFRDQDGLFPSLAKKKEIRFYLVTSRFKFLEKLTRKWLQRHRLYHSFYRILLNVGDFDPFEFKEKAIKRFELDSFIDDDLEVINFLKKKTKAKLFWIVPGHRQKSNNHDPQVETCRDFLEALRKILILDIA